MSTKTVYHPTLPASYDVPERDVEAWSDAGWRKTKPKAEATPEKPADTK